MLVTRSAATFKACQPLMAFSKNNSKTVNALFPSQQAHQPTDRFTLRFGQTTVPIMTVGEATELMWQPEHPAFETARIILYDTFIDKKATLPEKISALIGITNMPDQKPFRHMRWNQGKHKTVFTTWLMGIPISVHYFKSGEFTLKIKTPGKDQILASNPAERSENTSAQIKHLRDTIQQSMDLTRLKQEQNSGTSNDYLQALYRLSALPAGHPNRVNWTIEQREHGEKAATGLVRDNIQVPVIKTDQFEGQDRLTYILNGYKTMIDLPSSMPHDDPFINLPRLIGLLSA